MRYFQALQRFLVAGVLLVAISACDRDGGPEGAGPLDTPDRGGTAVLAEIADLGLPSPVVAQTDLDGNLSADVLYMELLRGTWDDGRLVYRTADENPMAIARRYEYVGPDSTAIRFHMRSDLLWSDGRPLTAHDVVYTYDLVEQEELASSRADYAENVDSVVAETDSTVVIHFGKRYPQMLFHSALPIIPRHVFEGTAPAEFRTHPALLDPTGGKLVVSGPFQIAEWRKGQQIVLEPNPHFQPRPHLDRIVFRIIPDPATRMVELQTGGVDFVKNVPFDQIPNLRTSAPHVRFERERQRNYDYVSYNPEAFPAFADPEIRRALGLAIDVPGIISGLQMGEYATPAGGPYAPIFSDLYDPELTPPLPYDPEEARRILEAKGWRDTNGDGIREKDGRPFRFTLVTNAGNQRRADASQIIQRQWRDIGVDARLGALEFNTFMGNLFGHDYEAALGGWIVGLSPDLSPLFSSDGQYNITGYGNPAVDSLYRAALSQPTQESAAPYWRRAAQELVSDHPYTWLYYLDTVDAVNNRLRDMRIDTYGSLQNTWEWWIPAERQRSAATPADTAGG